MKIKPGDWVRFYQGGKLVIAEVQYVKSEIVCNQLCTDEGVVAERNVLEVRTEAIKRGTPE